nr:MAG TPA: hypothetical protein [Bacteriophage sp.]
MCLVLCKVELSIITPSTISEKVKKSPWDIYRLVLLKSSLVLLNLIFLKS